MNVVLNWLYVGAVVLLLFGAAVFVHEWGHYIVARLRGLKVEAFAIGFGPKIFGWRKKRDRVFLAGHSRGRVCEDSADDYFGGVGGQIQR